MADTDKDGLTDEFERRIGTDPTKRDSDNDGLSDHAEQRLGTKPLNPDSDGDGYHDGNEIGFHRDPLKTDEPHPYARNLPNGGRDRVRVPTADDPDADGLVEDHERMFGTKPDDPDSDNDGLSDWVEFTRRTNPNSRYSDGAGDKTTDLDDAVSELKAARTPAPAGGSPAGGARRLSAAAAEAADDVLGGKPAGQPAGDIDQGVTVTGHAGRWAFLDHALDQEGDPYRFGAETKLDDTNPGAFDSSELVQWAAAQTGVKLPDGSWNQYRHLAKGGNAISVQDALKTEGALVFGFSSDPMASPNRPARAYVGISQGDGTVIDVSERGGKVQVVDAGNFYTHAAVIPEYMEGMDSDEDGVSDMEERKAGSDPFDSASTEGTPIPPDTLPEPDDSEEPPIDEQPEETPPSDDQTEQPAGDGEQTEQPSAEGDAPAEQPSADGEQTEQSSTEGEAPAEQPAADPQTEPTASEAPATPASPVDGIGTTPGTDGTTPPVDAGSPPAAGVPESSAFEAPVTSLLTAPAATDEPAPYEDPDGNTDCGWGSSDEDTSASASYEDTSSSGHDGSSYDDTSTYDDASAYDDASLV
jgi:hypothetical protein